MAQTCTICSHAHRTEIEAALVVRVPTRRIAAQYGASDTSIRRHRDQCLAPPIEQQQAVIDVQRERSVRSELDHLFTRVHKLFDACDEWLRDPSNPSRYELGPRADELQVTYTEWIPAGDRMVPLRKKETLARLLERLDAKGLDVERVESKHADPRQLVLSTAAQLSKQIELLAKLTGELEERNITVNIFQTPQWLPIEAALTRALAPHPEALEGVVAALAAVE